MGLPLKNSILFISMIACLSIGLVVASGDQIPLYSGETNSYTVSVVYAREWEYASGARNDGPMLVVKPSSQIGPVGNQVASLYYIGNIDVLKMYQSVLLAAQAANKSVTIRYNGKWCRYKNVLDDADFPINGMPTGFKILGIDILS